MKKIFIILFVSFCLFLFACKKETKYIREETKEIYTVEYKASNGGYISGEKIQTINKGEDCKIVKAIANPYYHFVSWSDGKKDEKRTDLNIKQNLSIEAIFEKDNTIFPAIYIDTFGKAVKSKEEYVKCNVSIDSVYEEYIITDVSANIKGRGNSTWGFPKKPYKLKFDEKIDLFGNGSAKSWTLIANYCDQSLVRNYLAYGIGQMFSDYIYSTSTQFAEVYLNNEYLGLYLICEQVEIGSNRIDISQSEDINTGYLIEMDFRIYDEHAIKDLEYFEVEGIPYVIKDPDTEETYYSYEHTKYIKEYVQNAYSALLSHNYQELKKYIDVDSFVYTYIIYELFGNVDVKLASWYLYKDKDGLLVSGPIWDFDITAGNIDYDDLAFNPNFLYAEYYNKWYNNLLKIPEFRKLVNNALYNNYYEILNYFDNTKIEFKKSENQFEKNFTKWDILGSYVWPNSKEMVKIKTWYGQVEYAVSWLTLKLNYMLDEFNE